MENIPTAEEFFSDIPTGASDIEYWAKEFTKLHVAAALKKASEKIKSDALENYGTEVCDCWEVESILNAYPLENIK